jgi:chromosome segregation ATPase
MMHYLIPAAQILLAIALLLVAILCLRLDAKLNALRKGKDGVAAAAGQLSQAVARADAAIKELRAHSEEATASLQQRIDEAQAVSDGLKFLATTARALEPKATQVRDNRWEDNDFRPARREPSATSRWDGLR